MKKNNKEYKTGDLVRKHRHNERMRGLVLERTNRDRVKVMWETGTATYELDDDLEHVATAADRLAYLIGDKDR